MPIHLLTSVTGSPGVSTLAQAWTRTASTPTLLLEACMVGGSSALAGPFRGQLSPDVGLPALAHHGSDEIAEQLWWHSLEMPGSTNRVIPTVATPTQARALTDLWPAIAQALVSTSAETGTDIVIDYGRLSTRNAATALLDVADTIIVLTPSTLAGINSTVRTVSVLRDELARNGSPDRLAVVPVLPDASSKLRRNAGLDARPFTLDEIRTAAAPTAVLAPLLFDPDGAWSAASSDTATKRARAYLAAVTHLSSAASEHAQQMRALAGRSE